MKISRLIVLTFFLAMAVLINGCVTTETRTELSDETQIEEEAAAEEEGPTDDEEEYVDEEEGIDEELLEEKVAQEERKLPDILKDDPELIELAEETGTLYTIYFDYDSHSIGTDFTETIKKNAQWMKSNPKKSIILEGHADERGGNEYNLALGQRRAQGIKKFLVDFGVNEHHLKIVSYGEELPANDEHNEAAWKENRRVVFRIFEIIVNITE